MRIIYVEDDGGLRSVVMDTLQYLTPTSQIEVYSNSDDVLRVNTITNLCLVLMDVRLPGSVNGFSLAKHLRSLGYDGIIALMSAYPRPPSGIIEELRCEWFSKPIDVDTLDGLIAKAEGNHPLS
jgi:DNA-binding NtrC family response regulator